MTVNTNDFYNWQGASKLDYIKYRVTSPNIESLHDYVMKRWGGVNLGKRARKRPIRGGTEPSTHSFGAAWDWRYPSRAVGLDVIKWLVANSKELGIQAIHDYYGCTIWRSTRKDGKGGWKKQPEDKNNGMGQKWATYLHIETTKNAWGNKVPVDKRL